MTTTLGILQAPKPSPRQGEIYAAGCRKDYERLYKGEFVAALVSDGAAYRGEFPPDALLTVRREARHGVLHLIRIGSRGASRVGYV